MRQLSWYSIKDFEETVLHFRELIDQAREEGNVEDLLQAKRFLVLYLRAIEKDLENLPISSMSKRLVEHEHKRLYKFD